MVFKSSTFINSPYNGLQDLFSEHVKRGDIVSCDGYTLATSAIDSEGNETREYPYNDLFAHVVGYSVNGKSGLENQYNFSLLTSHEFFIDRIANSILDEKNDGDTLHTSLNYELQERAYRALGDADGAVIVMEPKTGRILLMLSKPDFNPNTIEKNWDKINSDESTALYNRATQGQYAPGSTFKIFTALEYYREHPSDYLKYDFDCVSKYTHSGKEIHCAGKTKHKEEDLIESFANSCNCSFANISMNMDVDQFNVMLNTMLFNQDLPIAFESNSSKVRISSKDTDALIMDTAIGQGNTYVSPLHMLLIASAIDNDGVVMRPYLVDKITNASGTNVTTTKAKEYRKIFTEDECEFLRECMKAVTDYGTAKNMSGQSYQAYGKTGTAQVSDSTDKTNSWFVGYAHKDGYEDIAIAVIVEDSGKVNKTGKTIAKKIFDTYFN